MRKSKRRTIRWTTFILAGFALMGFLLWQTARERDDLKRAVSVGYDHAFSELSTAMGKLDTALRKVGYASSPGMVSATCSEAYAEALEAQMALGELPYGNVRLEETAAFISRVGDYLFFLSRDAASGNGLSQEARENVQKLRKSAAATAAALADLNAELLAGSLSLAELSAAEEEVDQTAETCSSGLAEGFKAMEEEFSELPTLIYDGPFSEHIQNAKPKRLEGAQDVTEEQAVQAAASFLGQSPRDFKVAAVRESGVPVYVINRYRNGEVTTVEVTKQGGRILYFGATRETGEPVISAEDCVKIAERFLHRQGFREMAVTYWEAEMGDVVVNFAHTQDGVVCYPDLIKVSVAMDTGAVSGYESLGYLMNHTTRTLPEPSVSQEDAQSRLAPGLTVQGHKLAVVPTSGQNEVFCHEFLCEDAEGSRCLVYVNAQTGAEERILLLLEDENGTLTV